MRGGEAAAEVAGELDINYEHFRERLIPELQNVSDKLTKTNRGQEVINDPDFRNFILKSSYEVEAIDKLVSNPATAPNQFRPVDHRNMYYKLSSLIDMTHRPHILVFIAEGLTSELDTLDDYETLMIRKRRLASVQEELGVITSGKESTRYAIDAMRNNNEVSESSIALATSPRKLHAQFATYDMFYRHLSNHHKHEESLSYGTAMALKEGQALFYDELAKAIATTRETDINEEAVSGSFGELLVLGRIRDRLIEEGRFMEVEASQSFIRQDKSDKSQLLLPPKWKWAHDLTIKNHITGKMVPVEVKKLRLGSKANAGNGPNTYLPTVEVVQFKLGSDKKQYLEIIEQYCRGKSDELSDNRATNDQALIIEMFESRVDREIDRVFEKLDNPEETATDYHEARKRYRY